ncbi:hypothetical protein [Paenibacillus maysiensis]|uniref:hypothetical protein n=1 Tax=Paenibacillus maysiensis TaxID=1155954 RepID=UPI0004723F97|nr:hypothetical protein [Paenibacillus maysiensis]
MRKKVYINFLVVIFITMICSSVSTVNAATVKTSIKYGGGNYYGEIKNGKPNGKGTMHWGKNKSYSGDWVNGKRSGQGKYINKNLLPSESDYDSYGASYIEEVTTYNGQWKNDKQNGEGVLTFKDSYRRNESTSRVEKGTFRNNDLVKGYSREQYGLNMTSYGYTNTNKSLSISTDRAIDSDETFRQGIDLASIKTLVYTTKDQKGNERAKTYNVIISNYVNEGDYHGYSYNIEGTETVNGKEINDFATDGEISNINITNEMYKLIKPFANGYDAVDSLAKSLYN